MAGNGGKRPGAGRKSNVKKALEMGFALSFFGRSFQDHKWKSMLESEDEAIVLQALKYLTDRLYGKAKEKVEVSGEHEISVVIKRVGV